MLCKLQHSIAVPFDAQEYAQEPTAKSQATEEAKRLIGSAQMLCTIDVPYALKSTANPESKELYTGQSNRKWCSTFHILS